MNSCFESPDGVVGVEFPDHTPRPRTPFQSEYLSFVALLPDTDIKMGWLPTLANKFLRIPFKPTQSGAYNASALLPSIAPVSFEPTLLDYLPAPRLHKVFPRFVFDPLSGPDMAVAQRMAWMPQNRIVVPHKFLKETTSVFYVPTLNVSVGTLRCTDMNDLALTAPAFISEGFSTPGFINEALTAPAFINEGLC